MKFKRVGIEIEADLKKATLNLPIKPKLRKKKDLKKYDYMSGTYTKLSDPVYRMYRNLSRCSLNTYTATG